MADRRHVHFHVSVLTTILLFITVITGATVLMVVSVSRRAVDESADQLFSTATELVRERVQSRLAVARDLATTGAVVGDLAEPVNTPTTHPAAPYLRETLTTFDEIYSLYVGHDNGDFLQFIHTRGDARIIEEHDAPTETVFIGRSIETVIGGTRVQTWQFLDGEGRILRERTDESPEYDPRQRPWYRSAIVDSEARARTVLSDPYVFNSLQQPGITASRRLPTDSGVFGVDLTLASLATFVRTQTISANGGAVVLDGNQRVLATHPALPDTLVTAVLAEGEPDDALRRYATVPGWIVGTQSWEITDGARWTVLSAAPESDFLRPFTTIRNRIGLVAFVLVLISVPFVLLVARSLTRVLTELAAEAERIENMDFSGTAPIRSVILEFHQLADGFAGMKHRLKQRTEDLNASLQRLEKIIDLNIAISAEKDIDRLSELILGGAQELAHADGGSLYVKNEATGTLDFKIVLNDSLGFVQGGTSGNPVTLPPVPLYSDDGTPNEHNVVSHTVNNETTVNIPDAYNASGFDFSGTRQFDETNGYRSQSFLTVPLKPRGSDIIGAIQLLNAKDPDTGETIEFSGEIQRFVEALSAGAATALYNRDLIEEQKRLFDAMIQLIAGAIDAKSPYTGGHCARVPEIALMLARQADGTTTGPLGDFHFGSDQDWRAFRIGAWLHDAGKVTTPDYVVDKATKLETIYNRIHEVRTRFEVLLRDARIERYEALLNGADPAEADARLAQTERELHDEFAFVAEANLGGEFMAPERVERLRQIGERKWQRHFDDTIGLSWSEQQRQPPGEPPALPVEEHLLADKPEHRIPRTGEFYTQYEKFGFTLPVPEDLYNQGELYNLSIGRGTLTPEERFKINEHVMQTIAMLDRLPFPASLKAVPEYAGTHHETLNGTGYPRQLTGDDLSIPARIMAIADIFEALTASDRPYKKAKPLSVAIDILAKFKADGHIDPDLFDLFLESGLYREYALKHLRPEQVDEVDISRYIG
jgi:HD-GYP domain-containing protein (c-di-GMP phosphodiesterase class II)